VLLALKIIYRLITRITNHSFGIIVSKTRRIACRCRGPTRQAPPPPRTFRRLIQASFPGGPSARITPQGRLLYHGIVEGTGFRRRDVVDRPEETETSGQDEVACAELILARQLNLGA
jgi:hypothetical protein